VVGLGTGSARCFGYKDRGVCRRLGLGGARSGISYVSVGSFPARAGGASHDGMIMELNP